MGVRRKNALGQFCRPDEPRGRIFPRTKTCAVHDFQKTGLRIASRRDGTDGYRIVRRCDGCGRMDYSNGEFVPVTSSVKR